jgi:Cof subfamily protein (haloacid dehalogenase superfamily)
MHQTFCAANNVVMKSRRSKHSGCQNAQTYDNMYIHDNDKKTMLASRAFGGTELIKLIIADLDGTLLDSNKKLPHNFPALVEALTQRGIVFAPASGRSYLSLMSLFSAYKSQMGFICDNGCAIYLGEELVRIAQIPPSELKRILDLVFEAGNIFPGFCGMKSFYIQDRDESFLELVDRYFPNHTLVNSLYDIVEDDAFCKVSCSDRVDVDTHGLVRLASLTDRYDLLPSGETWLDIAPKGENKGTALRCLMEKLGVTPDETMAFVDYVNDMPLMGVCNHIYAMKNGHPDVKAAANYVTEKTNDENGVIDTISKVLGLDL